MKKHILLFILSCFVLNNFAQTTPWIQSGATWYYQWDCDFMIRNNKIEYTHDTILYGKTCQVLKTTQSNYTASPPIGLISIQVSENYTYSNGDTVFYLVDTSFTILYNFGALPGETWDLGVDSNATDCTNSIVKVDSISSTIIASNPHRVLYVSDSANSPVVISGTIIEHIGSMTYLFPTVRVCDSSAVVDYCLISFACFSDSLENYSVIPPGECENPYHVGINEQNPYSNKILISPNPAYDQIYVNWNSIGNGTISLYNILGKLVLSKKLNQKTNETINVSGLESGVYFIYLKNKNEITEAIRFIKK